ncbi:MAG: hypothetical protein NTAFB09_11220 [Nitrosospira sp.]
MKKIKLSNGKRTAVLVLENDNIGESNFSFEVAETLRCYADMIAQDRAGCHAYETYTSQGGTRVTVVASIRDAVSVPYTGDRLLDQVLCDQKRGEI